MKIKKSTLLIVILAITFGLKAQNETVNGTLTVNGNIVSDAIIEVNADNVNGHVASRLFLKSHDDYRGAGIFSLGQTNNWFMGNPYTDHANSFMIGVAANSVGTNAIAQKQYAKFFINSNGNIGIGTTNPLAKLQVDLVTENSSTKFMQLGNRFMFRGDGVLQWGQSANQGILSWDTGRAVVGAMTGQDLSLYANGSEKLRVMVNGNVGIGTTSPQANLHVYNGNSNGFHDLYASSIIEGMDSRLQLLSTNGGSNGSSISLTNENSSWTLHQKTSSVGNRFDIGHRTSGTIEDIAALQNIYLSILKNGNTGIGTTNPGEKLEVNGLIKIGVANNQENNSPGIVSQSNDDFLYDNQYINHYAFGFHGFQDSTSSLVEPKNTYVSGYFGVDVFSGGQNRMRISQDGIVSIGSVIRQPGYKLAVNGKIKAKEIKVETGWSDFVFNEDYDLPTLKQVEQHIKDKGHLKDIPSAAEVATNGILVGEMNSKLLQKIEELTLYTINQEKRIECLESNNKKLMLLMEKLLKKRGEK